MYHSDSKVVVEVLSPGLGSDDPTSDFQFSDCLLDIIISFHVINVFCGYVLCLSSILMSVYCIHV